MRQENFLPTISRRRRISSVLAVCVSLAIMLPVILCCQANAMDANSNDTVKLDSWMKEIPDEKKLSQIMIPGAHNAAASHLPLSLFAKCQRLSITELLNAGYRYLDIRVGVDEEAEKSDLYIYHNFIPCYSKNGIIYKKITFNDVIESCYEFLDQNPSETIVLMIKYEHGNISVSEFENLVAEVIEKSIDEKDDKWLLTDETPALKEARGKIVLYRRYEDEASLGKESGIECIWDKQNKTQVDDFNNLLNAQNEEGLIVQDMYKLGTDDKWKAFEYVLVNYSNDESKSINSQAINFLSTAGTKSVGTPSVFARKLNRQFLDYNLDDSISPQWIIVDFGDERISDKIIRANFSTDSE